MLESTLEILQQFYFQVETQSDEFHLFVGDLSTYTLRCKRCGQHVTLHGSIEEILFHAHAAMLYHWNMIEPHDEQIHRELMLMPLFASYENYVRSSNSLFEGWNWMEDFNICQKPTKYGQSMFCEAVKVDIENSKKLSFHHTITSTLFLITVLFEDLFEIITLHREFSGEKVRLEPSTSLLNKTNTCDGYDFNIDIFTDEVNVLQKELLVLFEGFCIFGYREAYKNLLCILMVVNKTIYGNNGDVPDILLNMFLSSSSGIRNHINRRVVAPDPVFPQSYQTILNKQEFIIHNSVTLPVQYSLSTLPTMSTIYDKPGAGWDRINIDNYFTSYFKTNEMSDLVQQEKNLQHHNSWKRITLL
jgi:hypothetical protein